MALVSPGVEVQIIDESIYAPTAVATVPLIVVATAENKLTPAGDAIAAGTTALNANKLNLVSSQRELTSLYGSPLFYKDSAGTPLHGYEINEYGLFAAFSALGVSNRVYVLRADVDLSQLVGTSARPRSAPIDGTLWLDLAETQWGLFEWNASTKTFVNIDSPILITSTNDLTGGVPKTSIGNIGDYAIVTTNTANPVYFKRYDNAWVLVGSSAWQNAHPAIQSSEVDPELTNGSQLVINGTTITLSGFAVSSLVTGINAANIAGVTARNNNNRLEIFATSAASSDGSTMDSGVAIENGNVGDLLGQLGISAATYYGAAFRASSHVSVPRWKATDPNPRPTGSVWSKTTNPNSGANIVVKRYNALTAAWNTVAAPLYNNDRSANAALDANGGLNIARGSFYVDYDVDSNSTSTFKLFTRSLRGITTATGTATNPSFTISNSFAVRTSAPASNAFGAEVTVTMTGTTAASFVSDVLAANIPYFTAEVTTSGAIRISHTAGGEIQLRDISSPGPVAIAGFTAGNDRVRASTEVAGAVVVSNWVPADYTASAQEPTTDPEDGTYWFNSDVSDVDIMIHDGNQWRGYRNITSDARGFDLEDTDALGPIVAATQPQTQNDGVSPLSLGDLWIDTSDLENYPTIYRYENINDVDKWVLIDTADQTSESGILFADVRWDTSGATNVVTDAPTEIASMLTSDYVDLDAPDADLYPRGMLLWNTRRSGGNVKRFASNYFNAERYPDSNLPSVKNTWQNASGNRADGSPYMGRKAVRIIVQSAIAAALDSNSQIREEQNNFNLIACPGYPEIVSNMVALNNDRRNTAFVVADTPMRLAANGTALQNWATGGAEDSITTADPYVGVFYPSGVTNNPFTTGNATVLVPPSHMALRMIIRNDDVAFPWFAPAGTRRGLIDNATRVGYIDAATGELQTVGLTESLRDTMYENKINPVTLLPGVGLVNYGQKTLSPISSALDRINVARLVVYIRERLQQIVKPFLFEPNDKITRDEAKQVVESLMNDLVAKRGLYDYLVICDDTNNTSDRIDRNELYIDIAIEPVKAVEFIYIPVRIKNTGEISG
jgi:hypothetical protein